MFNLCNFQMEVYEKLIAFMQSTSKKTTLKSPTGSGKTLMLTHFMNEYTKMNDDAVFIWFTPGKGNLEEQSKKKMDLYFPESHTKLLSDVLTSGFESGDCCFLNWESLNKESNKALKDGDRDNLKDKIKKAENNNLHFYVIIDESHTNDTTKANTVLSYFNVEKTINASATPKLQKGDDRIEVTEYQVIQEGLIKKYICFNSDAETKTKIEGTEPEYLIRQGLQKREEILEAYRSKGVYNINPLLLIQIPNNNKDMLEEVERVLYLDDIDKTYENCKLANMVHDKPRNRENVEALDSKVDVMIFKQAIATGWDCPRAHILVKLRDQSNETFEIQVIGRIRRMPEAKHYENVVLDNCYVYTFDKKFTNEVKDRIGDETVQYEYLGIRKDIENIKLTKELKNTNVTIERDFEGVTKLIYDKFVKDYGITDDIKKNAEILAMHDFIMSKDIVHDYYKGDVNVFSKIIEENFAKANAVLKLDTHFHGRMFLAALNDIGSSMRANYRQIRKIVNKLFGDAKIQKKSNYKKILNLTPKEMYAFVINNLDNGKISLKKIFIETLSVDMSMKQTQIKMSAKNTKEFNVPKSCMFFYKTDRDVDYFKNNVYEKYNSQAHKRSASEKEFERYLSKNKSVKWWYKNGDKGDEFFSILYADNTRNEKLFYPDYIMKIDKDLWIVETKGGEDDAGYDENIDEFARMKYEALANYLNKDYSKGIKGCFIRLKKSNNKLYACVCNKDNWTDDMSGSNWTEISKVL